MARLETVVCSARNSREAEGFRDALEAAGLEARVADGDSDIHVLVAEQDALVARQVVGDMAGGGSAAAARGEGASAPAASDSLPKWWPKCPGCGAPRSTSCPICGTSGSNFQAIDMGFSLIEGLDDAVAGPGASCGPGGCGPAGCSVPGDPAPDGGSPTDADSPPDEGDEDGADMAAGMVICPTCDEPFQPNHPKLCEWCNHEFSDGFEVALDDGPVDHDEFSGRVYIVIGALLAIVFGASLYFGFVVY